MLETFLQRALTLNTQLAAYGPLTAVQEVRLRKAAEVLIHTLEITLHERQGPEVELSPMAARLALFETVVRPFFQKMMPHLSQLQNSFTSSQSWFAYQTQKQEVQDVFTLDKLRKAVQTEEGLERVMLVSHMKQAQERKRTAVITRVSLIFTFKGPQVLGSYKIDGPTVRPVEVGIVTADFHQPLTEDQLTALTNQTRREIRTVVWENNF